jgi:ATP-binding protein involved in chromosome partitioning
MAPTPQEVLQRLAQVPAPDGRPLPETGTLSDIVVSDGKAFFSITVDAAVVQRWESVRKSAEAAVRGMPGIVSALVALTAERAAGAGRAAPAAAGPADAAHAAHAAPRPGQAPEGVKSIIAVASGKGGVGKSTTAVNLALGMSGLGLKVGLLDADIYGPSVPKLLAIRGRPRQTPDKRIIPMTAYGLTVMSIGLLTGEETPMIWRGPMVIQALTDMLNQVIWGELDLMVVDMPPGTGDAQLTMAQRVPLAGAVIVSTPQDLALIDARRGIAMFRRVNVPVLGIVENMSYFLCPQCGSRSDIFGHGGARHEAERLGVPFLGEVPLDMAIRETSDAGRPVVATAPDGPHAAVYRDIAAKVLAQLRGGERGRAAPRIVVEA